MLIARRLGAYARELFGGCGGLLQQRLVHCARLGLLEAEENRIFTEGM